MSETIRMDKVNTEEPPKEEVKEPDSGITEEAEEQALEPEEGRENPEPAEAASEEEAAEDPAEKKPQKPAKISLGKKHPRKHKRKHRILRLVIAAAVVCALVFTAHLPYFQIRQTPVIGNKTVSDEEILELSGIHAGGSIFLINPWRAGSRIKDNLYIETVKIHRELPGSVEIIVTEREAAAQLEMKDKKDRTAYVITDREGMVMGKSDKKQDVTMITEVTVTDAAEGAKLKVKETGTYHKAMDLIAAARQGDLYFKKIQIKGSRVNAYIYDQLLCKGRYQNMISSIESGQLKAVVYRLYQEDVSKGTINIGDNNYCSFTPKK